MYIACALRIVIVPASPVPQILSLYISCAPHFVTVHLLCPTYCHCTSPVPQISSLYISCAQHIVTVHLLCPRYRHCTSPVPQISSLYISCASSIVTVYLLCPKYRLCTRVQLCAAWQISNVLYFSDLCTGQFDLYLECALQSLLVQFVHLC